MTRQEFEESVDRLMKQASTETLIDARVFVAAAFVIKQRRGIPEDEMATISPADVAVFLAGLDRARKRKLKKIADGVIPSGVEPIH